MFRLRLAEHLGKTIEELDEKVDSYELALWQASEAIDGPIIPRLPSEVRLRLYGNWFPAWKKPQAEQTLEEMKAEWAKAVDRWNR